MIGSNPSPKTSLGFTLLNLQDKEKVNIGMMPRVVRRSVKPNYIVFESLPSHKINVGDRLGVGGISKIFTSCFDYNHLCEYGECPAGARNLS